MATEFDQLLFDQHFEAALGLPAAKRWTLERDPTVPLGVFLTVQPRSAAHETYIARLRWSDYSKPVSLKFVDPASKADCLVRAWPKFDGARPESFFVCAPWTKEGHDHHSEWAGSSTGRYVAPEEPLVFALLQVQHLLDNTYQGRAAP